MNKKLMLIAVLLIVPMLLAACGGDDMDPADAERGLESFFKGDFDAADDFICEEEIESAREELEALDEEAQAFMAEMEVDASCEKDGDTMACSVSIMGEDTGETVNINIEDGKLCGLPE